jgi:hypothetical protein
MRQDAMMRTVGAIGSATTTRLEAGAGCPIDKAARTPATAVVPVVRSRPVEARLSSGRPMAAFVAQLIAADRQVPQTRARRRAEPEEAIAIYTAASQPRPGRSGQLFRRSF